MTNQELIKTLEEIKEHAKRFIEIEKSKRDYWEGKIEAYVNSIGLVKQLDEPQVTAEQAWNKIAEAYPESVQSLRNTLDNAVFGNASKSQKPVIPRFVAEWIEKIRSQVIGYHFESGARFLLLIGNDFHSTQEGLLTAEFRRWLEKDGNEIKLSNAIDYGYKVEQEPLYMVPLLTDKEGNKKILVERRGEYDIIWDYENEEDWHELLTEEQIKSVNSDYWKFAVLYEPNEEVTEG